MRHCGARFKFLVLSFKQSLVWWDSDGLRIPAIAYAQTLWRIQKKCAKLINFSKKDMVIERTNKNKLTITMSSSINSYGLQRLIDYVKYLEATSKSKAKQADVDKLADDVNSSWWTKNKKRFVK